MKKFLPAQCIATFLIFFACQLPLSAQWETKGPYGGYVTSLAKKDASIFAGTFVNGVFRSTDGGKTWTAANKGMEGNWIMDVQTNASGVFAGSFYYGVYFSADNGLTWSQRNNGLFSTEVQNIFASGTDLFVTTMAGIYYSSDNGLNWSKRYNGMSSTTRFRSWAQMGDTIYGGSNGQGIYRTNDKGLNWVKVTSASFPAGAFYIFSMATEGNTIYASTNNGIYASTDGGINWNKQGPAFSAPMYAAALAVHSGSLFAGAGYDGIFVSGDMGATFTPASNGIANFPAGEGYVITEELLSYGSTLLAAMQFGVYRSTDNGANWSDSSEGLLNTSMQDVVSNGEVIVATTDYAGTFITDNKGMSWKRANNGLPGNRMRALAASGKDVFASVLFGKVYRSADNAASWTWAGNGLPSTVYMLEADNSRVLAVVEAPMPDYTFLFQTTDKGSNWTKIPTPQLPSGITAVAVRNQFIYVGGTGSLLRSSDNGENWVDLAEYLPMVNVSTILSLDSVTYVGTQGKGIYRFSQNDTYMKSVSKGLTNYNISDIVLQDGILFAATLGGGVFVSADKGENWFAFNGGLNNPFVKKLAGATLQMYAATRVGTYHTINATFESIQVLASVSDAGAGLDVSFFPNPSAGIITIQSGQANIAVEIYDIRGARIYSGNIATGSSIDLSTQPKGIYVMKLSDGVSVTSKRIIRR